MPGKHIVGVVGDLRREDEGEYVCPKCTVFGLEYDEAQILIKKGLVLTDCNKQEEGYEVKSSVYKVLRALGTELGFEPYGDPIAQPGPNNRAIMIYTMMKDV